jgi:MPBQ/MSBQ methyltransferase
MSTDTSRTAAKYDRAMYDDHMSSLWANSDFFNFGYWEPGTTSHRKACEDLMDALLAYLPEKPALTLDVACGLGATTGHIASRYPDSKVVGANISAKQLNTAKQKHPDCRFVQMDAVTLALPDNSFDAVICVEAAFHFDTRERFIQEAYRVLKPGGLLLLSDILAKPWTTLVRTSVTMRNLTVGNDEYRHGFSATGFTNLKFVDITTEAVTRLCRYHRKWSWARLRQTWDVKATVSLMLFDLALLTGVRQYLIVAAQKPRP